MGENKYVNIQLEDVKVDVKYAITINPNDHYQFEKKANRQDVFIAASLEVLKEIFGSYAQFKLELEVSSTGRLHWHGTIEYVYYQGIRKFYVESLPKLKEFGTFCIKPIKDANIENSKYSSWEEYTKKQSSHFGHETISYEDEIPEDEDLTKLQLTRRKNLMKVFTECI